MEDDIGHILIMTFIGVEGSGSGRGVKEGAGREGRKGKWRSGKTSETVAFEPEEEG